MHVLAAVIPRRSDSMQCWIRTASEGRCKSGSPFSGTWVGTTSNADSLVRWITSFKLGQNAHLRTVQHNFVLPLDSKGDSPQHGTWLLRRPCLSNFRITRSSSLQQESLTSSSPEFDGVNETWRESSTAAGCYWPPVWSPGSLKVNIGGAVGEVCLQKAKKEAIL